MESPVVAIVGGGLAGVSAALTLSELGIRSALFERSPQLGGRAGTYAGAGGFPLDIGQHVYLGCCTAYRDFLEKLGVARLAPLAHRLDLAFVDAASGRIASLRSARLPFPFSLAAAVMRYGHLGFADRLRTLAVILRARAEYRKGDPALESFADWLRRQRVGARAVDTLWEPLILAALNARPHEVSARSALMVIAEALAGGPEASAVGVSRVPLSALLEPAARRIAPHGRIRLRAPVRAVETEPAGVRLASGELFRCDAVIVATSHRDAARLLPAGWREHPFFARLDALPARPIVNVYLRYDRPVVPRPMVGVLRSPLQWLFDLNFWHADHKHDGHLVAVPLSGAEAFMRQPASELVRQIDEEIRRVFGAARDARLLDAEVRKMAGATFSPAPGDERLRPLNRTPIPRLFLAGDYTQTGWPSTMESAVRSGRAAAREVASALGKHA